MNSRILKIVATVFCLSVIAGCGIPRPQVPIIKPQLIDQRAANDTFIPKYCDLVAKTDRMGFEIATAICRRVQTGDAKLSGVKSSANGRYFLYMFQEKEGAGVSKGDYSVIAFSFNPGSELVRTCNQAGLCDIHVRHGEARFGRTNVSVQGEPTVNDSGITIKFGEDQRSYAFDLLFSYGEKNKREGDELIGICLSAFPVLGYE